jgi:hypothetical protein
MTPNNLIHEFGHYLSRAAGFEFPKLGSIETTLDPFLAAYPLATRYDRDGLGLAFLRQQIIPGDFSTLYYVHATIDPDGSNPNVAVFTPITTDPVPVEDYLLYDLFETNYPLWNSALNIYPPSGGKPTARVDLFVQNYPLLPGPEPRAADDVGFDFTRRAEITADAFLNWVRASFVDTKGQAWLNFFEDANQRIGMFLRNAVIWNYPGGMVGFYKDQGVIPQTPIATSTSFAMNYSLRLAPQEIDATLIGSSGTLPSSVSIYRWLDAGGILGDGISTYWLLIADGSNRLLWIASAGITHDENQVKAEPPVSSQTVNHLNPSRSYDADTDLIVIIGG